MKGDFTTDRFGEPGENFPANFGDDFAPGKHERTIVIKYGGAAMGRDEEVRSRSRSGRSCLALASGSLSFTVAETASRR